MKDYFIGRGFLHPEKLKIAEKYRGKSLVDAEGATEHKGVLEIRLCPYMYYCMLRYMFTPTFRRSKQTTTERRWKICFPITKCNIPKTNTWI